MTRYLEGWIRSGLFFANGLGGLDGEGFITDYTDGLITRIFLATDNTENTEKWISNIRKIS